MERPSTAPILFFDADCLLCDRSVIWVAERDAERRIWYCSFESAYFRELRKADPSLPSGSATVLVYSSGRYLQKSEAVLSLVRQLKGPWRWLALARLLPRPIRDGLYELLARNRYAWFGRVSACSLASSPFRDRLIP